MMPIGFYIVPYSFATKLDKKGNVIFAYRRVDLCKYQEQFETYGVVWHEVEILGNRAIVKIKASQDILESLDIEYKRLPKDKLNASLADLSQAAKDKIKNELIDMGYSLGEIKARFGNDVEFANYTLKDVLKFMAQRRKKPRNITDSNGVIIDIAVDGDERPCAKTIEILDSQVT